MSGYINACQGQNILYLGYEMFHTGKYHVKTHPSQILQIFKEIQYELKMFLQLGSFIEKISAHWSNISELMVQVYRYIVIYFHKLSA